MSLFRIGLMLSPLALSLGGTCAAQKVPDNFNLQRFQTIGLPNASLCRVTFLSLPDRNGASEAARTGEQCSVQKSFAKAAMRGIRDQKEIYLSPFRKSAIKADISVAAVTTGLVISEPDSSEPFAGAPKSTSLAISDAGLYGAMGTIGAFYLSSFVTHDAHAKETGLLGGEAIANAAITFSLIKIATGRERPQVANQNGRFWEYNRLSSSFPSGHSALTWAGATVVAHEYPKRWVQILAYGTAAAVSFTRYSGRQHFPSDVLAGSVVGYFVGRHIFQKYCKKDLSEACRIN